MSEVQFTRVDGGGNPPPATSGKKKFKIDKKVLFGVGLALVVILVFINKRQTSEYREVGLEYPNPENGVDVQAQLDSFANMMGTQLEGNLNQALTAMRQENGMLQNDLTNTVTNKLNETVSGVAGQLNDFNTSYKDQFDNLGGQLADIGQKNSELTQAVNDNIQKQLIGLKEQQETIRVDISKNNTLNQKQDAALNQINNRLNKPQPKPVVKPSPKPVAKPKQSAITIRRGDTLSAISKRTGVSVSKLARDNGIRNPNRIYAGNKLVIKK